MRSALPLLLLLALALGVTDAASPHAPATAPVVVPLNGQPGPDAPRIAPPPVVPGAGATLILATPLPTVPVPAVPATPGLPDDLTEPSHVTIRKGDTLSSLSRSYHTRVADLMRLNHLTAPDLRVGDTLIVEEHLCGVVTCTATPGGITAPDGTVLTRDGNRLTLSTRGPRTLWPELARVWLSGEEGSMALLARLVTACQDAQKVPALIQCVDARTITVTRRP